MSANFLTSRRADVPSIVFAWERRIPFVPWTIVPYWSIDVFYGLSVFVCKTREELDGLVRRLLTAQAVAATCFLVFPLKFAFAHPDTHGIPHVLFRALAAVDRPFNQAPSLHIALLAILWRLYASHVRGGARVLLHVWFALIGLSVLTTYQHHVFDVPTGALLGVFCIWLWPQRVWTPDAVPDTRQPSARDQLKTA
jgi:membrane-associated phospholipid phosphatase